LIPVPDITAPVAPIQPPLQPEVIARDETADVDSEPARINFKQEATEMEAATAAAEETDAAPSLKVPDIAFPGKATDSSTTGKTIIPGVGGQEQLRLRHEQDRDQECEQDELEDEYFVLREFGALGICELLLDSLNRCVTVTLLS
jgi:hypothetical protein